MQVDVKKDRHRIPGWAIATCIAVIAVCVAFIGYGQQIHDQHVFSSKLAVQQDRIAAQQKRISADENAHRFEDYVTCLVEQKSASKFISALTELRDADRGILREVKVGVSPATSFGEVDLKGIKQRVDAYNKLLDQTGGGLNFNCATLK